MGISRIAAVAFGAAMFVGSASLALAQQAPQGAYPQQMEQAAGRGGHSHFLTPEERAMWRLQHRSELQSLSQQQRQAYRQQLHQQLQAMAPQQKAQLRDQLQAQWNQLPQQRQQAIEQRIAQHQQRGYGQQRGAYQNGQAGQTPYPSQGGSYQN
jgi:hypothetical protein